MVFMIRALMVFILIGCPGPWCFHTCWTSKALMVFMTAALTAASRWLLPATILSRHFSPELYGCTKKGLEVTNYSENSAPPSSLFSVAWEVLPPKLRCGYFEATNVNSRSPQLLHQKPTFPHFWDWHFILMRQRDKVNSILTSLLSHRATKRESIISNVHSYLIPTLIPPPAPSIFAIKSISWLGHCGPVVCYKSPM